MYMNLINHGNPTIDVGENLIFLKILFFLLSIDFV